MPKAGTRATRLVRPTANDHRWPRPSYVRRCADASAAPRREAALNTIPWRVFGLLALATPAAAQPTRLRVSPTSKITILGTSNVHKWDCSTAAIDAKIDVP